MRVLLLAANTETDPYPVYPLGLSLVAAAMEEAGHHVRQCDLLCMRFGETPGLAEEVRAFRPQAVGISLRNIDNVDSFTSHEHWSLDALRILIAELRGLTSARLVVGGPGFSLLPEAILEYCGADYGIAGAGEESFAELLRMLEAGESAPRILHAPHTERQRPPRWEPVLLEFYARESGVVGLQTKRGCAKCCLYCTYPALEGPRIRAREPGEVLEDIERLTRAVSFKELFFTDAVFNDAAGKWLELVETMAQAGLRVPWTAFFQPEGLSAESLGLCARTGLMAVEFGTDAACDACFTALRKGFCFADVLEADRLCREANLPCMHYIMFGGPGENETTLAEGLANLDELRDSLTFAFLGIRLYAGSALMDYALREGSALPGDSTLRPSWYFSPHIDRERTAALLSANFRKKRLRLFPPEQGFARMEALRRLGFRGILWDRMIRRTP